jgi:hypothetical protein
MSTDLEPFLPVTWLAPAGLVLSVGNIMLRMVTSTPVFRSDHGPSEDRYAGHADRYISVFEEDDPDEPYDHG